MNNKLQPVTITLNGREVSGYPGMTILDLANESGVYIPTLCHDKHLSPVGACRLCLVEDEQTGRLMASCVTPITAGMVINTDSTRVIEHRKTIIKLILASHPDSCLVCDKGNRCQLRTIAAEMGVGLIEFERIPKPAAIEEVNPFIERDLSKCVLCAKCIRACQELVVEGAIDYFQRGFVSKVSTMDDMPLENSECTFCGTCVALCPTGALMEKDRVYTGTVRDKVETTCPYCACGCTISAEVKDNRIVRVRPGKEGVNNGTLCVGGSYGCDFIHSPDRLERPLIKKDDGFEDTSWEEALKLVADEFIRIKDKHGADSLAVLGSPKCTNEENYLLQMFARCVLGTNNIDNSSRLYDGGVIPGEKNDLNALEQADVIIVIGANPALSAPLVEYAVKRAVKFGNARLILIDPRRTNLSSMAHIKLEPNVGTDVALLNGMARAIINKKLLDTASIDINSKEYKEYAETLAKYSPEYVESVTGVPDEQIQNAARMYAGAEKAAIIYGTGITQYKNGADSVKALYNLAHLTGNVGGSLYSLQRDSNSRGAGDMGATPDFFPGYRSVTDAGARKEFEKCWKASLPDKPGLSALEIIEQAKAGKIKALWIVGENPALSFPNRILVEEALAVVDFLVVQDMFLTETAELAKVVLPAASFAEKEGTFTNFEGRLNRLQKVIATVGESLPDWQIILRLAEKMNCPLPCSSLEQVADEITERVYDKPLPGSTPGLSPVDYVPEKDENGYAFSDLPETSLYKFGSGTRSFRSKRLSKYGNEKPLIESREDTG
ncbi:molybdopterin-dependent oxidoreductase [Chloroflexota bacterium]